MLPYKKAMKLKENLKLIMEQREVSTTQLSRLANVRKQRISDWLGGVRPRDFDQVRAVALALEVTLEALLFDSASPDSSDKPGPESLATDAEMVFEVTVKRIRGKP
jgi:transcriptional regulator with XRE-family HTH domain